MNKLRLRTQLILFFILLIGLLLAGTGFYINWQLEKVVETEIEQRLKTVARVAAIRVNDTVLMNLVPGDDASRTAGRLHQEFAAFAEAADLSRLLIFDRNRKVLLDSEGALKIGESYFRLRFDEAETVACLEQRTATASRLFFSHQNEPFKAAYAPIVMGENVQGFVCVEGQASSFSAIIKIRTALLTIGLTAIIVAGIFGGFMAGRIVRPIEELTRRAAAIKDGQYGSQLQIGGSTEVVFLSSQISKMSEAIQERHQKQQMMLAGIAHEIRNPLGGIELFADLLYKQGDEKSRKYASKIRAEVKHLKKTVTDFLDYARPSDAKMAIINLRDCFFESKEYLGSLQSTLRWHIDIPATCEVFFDWDQLQRVLLNLIQNAVEALEGKDDAIITVSAVKERDVVLLKIQDNGPGIHPDERDKIFEPFYTSRHQGTGLGLAIVKMLLAENHGSISIQESDVGAVFLLKISHEKIKQA